MPERDPLLESLVRKVSGLERMVDRLKSFDTPPGNAILLGEYSASFPSTVVGTAVAYNNVHGATTTLGVFEKRLPAAQTDLLVEWIIAGSASGAPMDVRYAAWVGDLAWVGADYGGWLYRYTANSDRRQVVGWARCVGVEQGERAAVLRYRVETGTSINWNSGTDAWGYKVWEIPAGIP